MWDKITIKQYQDVLKTQGDSSDDAAFTRIAILEGKSLEDLDAMTIGEYQALVKKWADLDSDPPARARSGSFRVGKRKYRLITDARQINAGQYNEAVHFASGSEKKTADNLHYILATITKEYERTWYGGWKEIKRPHADKAEDLLHAPFLSTYQGCVFFWAVYVKSLRNLKDYFISQMMELKMTAEQAERMYTALLKSMDGFITLPG